MSCSKLLKDLQLQVMHVSSQLNYLLQQISMESADDTEKRKLKETNQVLQCEIKNLQSLLCVYREKYLYQEHLLNCKKPIEGENVLAFRNTLKEGDGEDECDC